MHILKLASINKGKLTYNIFLLHSRQHAIHKAFAVKLFFKQTPGTLLNHTTTVWTSPQLGLQDPI